jgi:uncharacterized protein (TIGR00375 family)
VPFYADLHIHSKFSRACSKDCDLEHLAWWARRKGIGLVGTGDFTHPAWFAHLEQMLTPAEPGLYALREDVDRDVLRTLPATCQDPVRFMLSVEISTIYKRDGATRKVHHLIYMPDLDAAREFNRRLGRIGNLGSDGRPILGLDSRDLLEIALESGAGAYLVPAHVWTPWFAVLGSKSGFDAVADCYADLADHIFALETGLSSDPEMNWRLSQLDRYRLVSNSDAHSPPMLGREASVFDTELDYFAIKRALETGDGYCGSIEFFPEEGKYHVDGHRKCDVRLDPAETRRRGGECPVCRKPVTVGVLHRIEELADRPAGARPEGAAGFRNLVQLPHIMGEILGVGPKSKAVLGEIAGLVGRLGPELAILDRLPVEQIRPASPLLAEAVERLRRGQVIRDAGYDGEYGVIKLFEPGELRGVAGEPGLFDAPTATPRARRPTLAPAGGRAAEPAPATAAVPAGTAAEPAPHVHDGTLLGGLDPDQRAAAELVIGPLLIVAGPGTGKTRTLTHRIAHLVTDHGVEPGRCLAITFTRRACAEMQERLAALAPTAAADLVVTTFHALGVRILREQHRRVGLSPRFRIADETQRLAVLRDLTGGEREARRALADLTRAAADPAAGPDVTADPDVAELRSRYVKALRGSDMVDFGDLIALPVSLLESEPDLVAHYRDRYRWISVDEYQDVDERQYRLLRLLTPPDGNLCAIGDPDQAIYSFRGADVGFFLRFQQDFPAARTVQLTRNYRSTPPILTAALQAVAPGTLVPDRVLRPMATGDQAAPIGVHTAPTAPAEAAFVTRTIDQLLGGQSFHSLDTERVRSTDGLAALSLSDIAVLYRTAAQAGPVMEALTRAGVPFQKRSHDRLADRPGVQALLRDLRYRSTAPPDDTDAEPVTVLARLREAAGAALDLLPITGGEEADEQRREIHSALDLLTPLAERCGNDLERFGTELALGAEVDTWDPRADRVSLLTLHAAKGLEFPVVFIVGCEDGLLPLRWSGTADDDAQVHEERRLFFVGITRAQEHLYLSSARERMRQGAVRETKQSPFLAAIDPALLDRDSAAPTRSRSQGSQLRLL